MTTERKPRPFNLWLCNRADGVTTIGVYINLKRRVIAEVRPSSEEVDIDAFVRLAKDAYAIDKRPFVLNGDPFPPLADALARANLLYTA